MEVLLSTDYKGLQSKILTLLHYVLMKEDTVVEDKTIIENALSLWIGCVLYEPSLMDDFISFKVGDYGAIDLILQGVVFNKSDKIKHEFMTTLWAIAKNLRGKDMPTPLVFFLGALGQSFDRVKDVAN
jgi:hypothetical protein